MEGEGSFWKVNRLRGIILENDVIGGNYFVEVEEIEEVIFWMVRGLWGPF